MKVNLKLNSLYKKLEKYKNFEANPKNCEKFLSIVEGIVLIGDPSSIEVLFKYFDDESEYSWVMESIMISLEHYKTTDFLNELSKNPKFYWEKSPLRTRGLVYGILNSPKDFSELKNFIHNFNSKDPFVEVLFRIINLSENPHHTKLIEKLKKELNHENKKQL